MAAESIRAFLSDKWIDEQTGWRMPAEKPSRKSKPDKWGGEIRHAQEAAEFRHARGAPTGEVREICRAVAERFVGRIEKLDFSPEKYRYENLASTKTARDLAEEHGGRWWKAGNAAGVEFETIRQPLSFEMPKLWMMAAATGDRELAGALAKPYVLAPVTKPSLLARFEQRDRILRHVLAGDMVAARAIARVMDAGYPKGFPKVAIEFPLGVLRKDAQMLRDATKLQTTSFKGNYDEKKHRRLFEKNRGRWKHPDDWESYQHLARSHVFDFHWVLCWWAIAWLNIARWHGIKGVFDKPDIFSEWIPRELCE